MADQNILVDVAKYFKGEDHQVAALKTLGGRLTEEMVNEFLLVWRKPVTATSANLEPRESSGVQIATEPQITALEAAKNKLATPFATDQYNKLSAYSKTGYINLDTKTTYYSQRDNYVMGGRTCNSSSNAMWVNWLRLVTGGQSLGGDDDYLRKLLSIGDTPYHENQTKCIEKYYGFRSKWIESENEPRPEEFEQVNGLLDSGFPVVVNINHRGPISAPKGGHVIMLIGRRKSEGTYIAHDPYGTLSSDYENENGRASLIGRADFYARWQGGRRVLA
jgi:Peptidase_C39 like family